MQEIGLKLQTQKLPVEVLVVDSGGAEKPSENAGFNRGIMSALLRPTRCRVAHGAVPEPPR